MQASIEETLATIASHYRLPNGNPPATLPQVLELPEAKARYAGFLKQADGDARSAATKTIESLLVQREELSELPVHVLDPNAYDIKGYGKNSELVVDESGNTVFGVRIILPDGHTRFLRNVSVTGLEPGQPVTLEGKITRTYNLVTGDTNVRISGDTQLTTKAHKQPFPTVAIGYPMRPDDVKGMKGGPFYIHNKRNTLSGKFGPDYVNDDGSAEDSRLYATGTIVGVPFANEWSVGIGIKFDDGNEGLTMLSPDVVGQVFGVPPSVELETYREMLGSTDAPVRILTCFTGDLRRTVSKKNLGGDEGVEAVFKHLQSAGLLEETAKGGFLLKIPNDIAQACVNEGRPPAVEVPGLDTPIVGFERSPTGYTNVYSCEMQIDDERGVVSGLTLNCHEETSKNGFVFNKGTFIVPLSGVGPLSYTDDNAIYAALEGFSANAEVTVDAE